MLARRGHHRIRARLRPLRAKTDLKRPSRLTSATGSEANLPKPGELAYGNISISRQQMNSTAENVAAEPRQLLIQRSHPLGTKLNQSVSPSSNTCDGVAKLRDSQRRKQ